MKTRSVSVFAIGAIVGIAIGVLDVVTMIYFAPARPEATIPLTFWISVPLAWITLCLAVALVFSLPPLRRYAFAAVIFGSTSVFLFSRVAPFLYEAFGLSLPFLGVVSLLFAVLLAATCSYMLLRIGTVAITHRFSMGKAAAAAVLGISCAVVLVRKPVLHSSGVRRLSARPNIVLVFLDTLREDDSHSLMPALRRFSRESVAFDNAWAPAPWTVPSHLAVLTGRDGWQEAGDNRDRTLAEMLRANAYSTWAIFANPELGTEPAITRGYSRLPISDSSGVAQSGIGFLLSRSNMYGGPRFPFFAWMSAPEVTAEFNQVVSVAQRPYFVTLNYMDPHSPYYVLPRCRGTDFQQPSLEQVRVFRSGVVGGIHLPDSTAQAVRSAYRTAIRCMDASIDRLLRSIEEQPDSSRTVVVFVGDHGEQFGEHGFTMHGNSIYRSVLHVPLLVHIPGVPAAHITDPVSITDLHDTLENIALHGGASSSTWPLFNASIRRPVISELAIGTEHAFGIADAAYHFIRWDGGKEEWYAYPSDPEESHPLSQPQTEEAAILRHRLIEQSVRHSTTKPFRALGYIQ